jgi:peptide deformylase
LSAPQIGVLERVILYQNYAKELVILVNPKIVSSKGETVSKGEGCLSVPGVRKDVRRAKVIKVEAFDEQGKKIKIKANGMEAIILQHEIDHLDGILFIDRANQGAETHISTAKYFIKEAKHWKKFSDEACLY